MDARGTTEVVSWVLGFGDKARVVEPAALVAAVAGELERARALYARSSISSGPLAPVRRGEG